MGHHLWLHATYTRQGIAHIETCVERTRQLQRYCTARQLFAARIQTKGGTAEAKCGSLEPFNFPNDGPKSVGCHMSICVKVTRLCVCLFEKKKT